MENPVTHDPTLVFIWGQYRIWAATAARLKNEITRWRVAAFVLTVLGALTAILSQGVSGFQWEALPKISGWVSAAAVGIAGYAGSKMLSAEKEKKWIQARAAAQQCKSDAYLYLLKVPPYNSVDSDVLIFDRAEGLIRLLSSIPQSPQATGQELKDIPPADYTFYNYLDDRIKNQAQHYYLPQAERCRQLHNRGYYWGIGLSVAGFGLGSLGATVQYPFLSLWVAFISTATASITSFVAANRYQYLSMSYRVMANQLMVLWAKGSRIQKEDIEKQKKFIASGEEILTKESQAWVAEMGRENEPASTHEQPAMSSGGSVL
jgi:hypothetical protein